MNNLQGSIREFSTLTQETLDDFRETLRRSMRSLVPLDEFMRERGIRSLPLGGTYALVSSLPQVGDLLEVWVTQYPESNRRLVGLSLGCFWMLDIDCEVIILSTFQGSIRIPLRCIGSISIVSRYSDSIPGSDATFSETTRLDP